MHIFNILDSTGARISFDTFLKDSKAYIKMYFNTVWLLSRGA